MWFRYSDRVLSMCGSLTPPRRALLGRSGPTPWGELRGRALGSGAGEGGDLGEHGQRPVPLYSQQGSGSLSAVETRLEKVRIKSAPEEIQDRFPFSVPSLQGLGELPLPGPVTIFVGENGSGKSTLLEAIALATGLPTVGQSAAVRDESLSAQRELAERITLVWKARSHRGFFLRAEDFFGFTRRLSALKQEMEARIKEVDRDFAEASDHTRLLAKGPAASSIAELDVRYGEDLDANSHGESFLRLFESRLVPGGLFLLDEPEAALSPQSQLAFLAMMSDQVQQGGQFVLATHSPVLMAIPGATLYDFDQRPVSATTFEDLESVALLRSFLQAPERYLQHLWPSG